MFLTGSLVYRELPADVADAMIALGAAMSSYGVTDAELVSLARYDDLELWVGAGGPIFVSIADWQRFVTRARALRGDARASEAARVALSHTPTGTARKRSLHARGGVNHAEVA